MEFTIGNNHKQFLSTCTVERRIQNIEKFGLGCVFVSYVSIFIYNVQACTWLSEKMFSLLINYVFVHGVLVNALELDNCMYAIVDISADRVLLMAVSRDVDGWTNLSRVHQRQSGR